jgi:hypothetical protein
MDETATTTKTRNGYGYPGAPLGSEDLADDQPATCGTCGQTFPTELAEFLHDCERLGRTFSAVPHATRRSDSVDAPERHESSGRDSSRPTTTRATEKQLAFLERLLADLHPELGDTGSRCAAEGIPFDYLTKQAASEYIDRLLEQQREAQRRSDRPANPATERQLAFLEKLLRERPSQREAVPHPERLSKSEASQLIDALLQRPKEAAASQPRTDPALPDVPQGHYAIESTGHNDLAFYRVDRPTEGHWAGRTFVKLVVGGHPDQNVPRSHVAGILERISQDPDSAARYGRELGRCCRCNRTLTDETSRSLGIGPECRSKT